MYDEAQKIFDHLPIRRNEAENNYIEHLWGALEALDECEERVSGFAMLPLHLLFLLAIQCKLVRVARERKDQYALSIILRRSRGRDEDVLEPTSPFDLGVFYETELAELCRTIGLSKDGVGRIKSMVQYRNDSLAHVKGYVEMNPDDKVSEYLSMLDMLQSNMQPLNDSVASSWLADLTPEDDLQEFVESRLLGSYLCPADFAGGLLKERFAVFDSQ